MPEQMANKRAILLFVLVIPLLTELLSGNTPLTLLMNPVAYGFFLVAYSIPALIIRELYVRRHMGVFGLVVLGLAYGVFNEGVVARTILQTGEMLSFHNYSTLGFNVPWVILIVPWHAFFSILYPIAIVHSLYPGESGKSWLSAKLCLGLGSVAVILGSIGYFSIGTFPPSPWQFLIACWVILVFIALTSIKVPQGPKLLSEIAGTYLPRAKYFLFGVLFGGIQVLSFIWGELRFSILTHLILVGVPYATLLFYASKSVAVQSRMVAFIALGHYSVWAFLMTFIVGVSGDPIVRLGAALVWLLLAVLWWKLSRQKMVESA